MTGVLLATHVVGTVKVIVVWPAGTVAVSVSVTAGFALISVTGSPAEGAAVLNVTVACAASPATTVCCDKLKLGLAPDVPVYEEHWTGWPFPN